MNLIQMIRQNTINSQQNFTFLRGVREMKLLTRISLCLALAIFLVSATNETFAQTKYPRPSQKAMIMQTVGDTDVTITYHRPNIKGRTLWGSKEDKPLVPNGEVWRTGANEATVFEVTNDVMINGQKLPKGKYSFYAIPNGNDWTLIFNKTWDQWGTVYDEAKDQLRVKTKSVMDKDSIESLAYMIQNVTDSTADITLAWGNARIPFKLDVGDVNARIIQNVNQNITSERINAANFIYATEQSDKYAMAISWLDSILSEGDSFNALFGKARLQAASGKKKEAIETAKKAVDFGKANKANPRSITFLEGLIKDWSGE